VLRSALRVNYAQPMKIKGGDKSFSHQPVWADADQYLDERLAEQEIDAHERREALKAAAAAAGDTTVEEVAAVGNAPAPVAVNGA
jgi:peptidyl-prolyl isomerase E (cyclophilin E)